MSTLSTKAAVAQRTLKITMAGQQYRVSFLWLGNYMVFYVNCIGHTLHNVHGITARMDVTLNKDQECMQFIRKAVLEYKKENEEDGIA